MFQRFDLPFVFVFLFAKTPEVAAKLSDMQQDGEIAKYYQAVITGELPDFEGEMVDYLLRDGKTNTTKVVKKGEKGAKRAELYYEVLDVMDTDDGTLSYVLIELVTGRHHKIRGDTKYNPKFAKTKRKYKQIGLFSSRMEFTHPITGEEIVIKKEPEGEAFEVLDLDEFE